MGLDLKARVSLDGSGFQAGLDKMEGAIGSFASRVGAIFTVGAIANFAKQVIDYGGQINDLSTRLGIGVMEVQKLGFAATQSGGDINDIAQAFTKLADSMETVRAGGSAGDKMLESFRRLGISFEQLKNLSTDQIFDRIGKGIETTGVTTEKTAAILDVFGRQAGKLIPILSELEAKKNEFDKSGFGLTNLDTKKLDELGDAADKAGKGFKKLGAAAVIGVSELVRALAAITEKPGGEGIDSGFLNALMGGNMVLGPDLDAKLEKMKRQLAAKRAAALSPDLIYGPEIPEETRKRIAAENAPVKQAPLTPYGARGDSLSGIGNFLGSGGALQTIADREKQNSITLKAIERAALKIVENTGGQSNSAINFP